MTKVGENVVLAGLRPGGDACEPGKGVKSEKGLKGLR